MIRFAWRQFRVPALAGLCALVIIGIVAAVTGPGLVHYYNSDVVKCKAANDCAAVTFTLLGKHRFLGQLFNPLILVVPPLLGIFWGAPLVAREFETGTYRLAWTQGVTRNRWLATKFVLGVVASMVTAGLFSLMVTWWSSPHDTINADRFARLLFDERNIAPVGYAAFAFALGVAAGVIIRRTLPAMATTLVVFVFVRLAIANWILPHLESPVHAVLAFGHATGGVGIQRTPSGIVAVAGNLNIPNAWVYSSRVVDNAGHAPTTAFYDSACSGLLAGPPPGTQGSVGQAPAGGQKCITAITAHYHVLLTYQPASRYWSFQWYDVAIYIALAALLGALSWWWIRHRAA
jgi:hypothetical protein